VRSFDVAVFDEVQICSNKTNKIADSWKNLKADFRLAQSADWFGSKLENQWTVAKQLWPDWLEVDHYEWIDEYMVTEYDHFTFNKKKVVSEKWPGFFASSLPCYVALPPAVEKPEPERRYVDLTSPQRKLYNQIEDSMVAEVEGNYLVIELPMHLRMRLLELSLGMFGVDEVQVETADEMVTKTTIRFDEGAPSSKLDEVRSIMRDYPNEHFIILTHSKKFAEKAAKDLGGLPYTGKQSEKQKELNKQAFIDGEVKVLVGTSAICEGLDGLQTVCRNAIVMSRPDVSYKTEQFIGRVARRGQERQVNVWEIVARDTLDVGVLSEKIKKALILNKAKAIQMKEVA
jgi:superfamily II DNA or RNA helicase